MRISETGPRPRIKLPLTSGDWIIELIAIVFLVFLFILPLRYYTDLPDKIPAHFNAAGSVDSYGSRATLWLLPGIGFALWLIMTILARFPYIFNYPVNISSDNAEIQYRLSTRMMRVLKTVILIMFSFISYRTIKIATGNSEGLGVVFLPLFLMITFGVITIYMIKVFKNRSQD